MTKTTDLASETQLYLSSAMRHSAPLRLHLMHLGGALRLTQTICDDCRPMSFEMSTTAIPTPDALPDISHHDRRRPRPKTGYPQISTKRATEKMASKRCLRPEDRSSSIRRGEFSCASCHSWPALEVSLPMSLGFLDNVPLRDFSLSDRGVLAANVGSSWLHSLSGMGPLALLVLIHMDMVADVWDPSLLDGERLQERRHLNQNVWRDYEEMTTSDTMGR